ncbi:unnamed protein product, partial [Meganyctiphanes norvegica]
MCHTGCNSPAVGQRQQQQQKQDDGDCCRRRRRWWWRGACPSSGTGNDGRRPQGNPTTSTTIITTNTTEVPSSETVVMDITSNRSSTTCASIPSTQKQQQHRHHQPPSSSSSEATLSSRSNTDRRNSLSFKNITSISSTREAHITSVVAEAVSSSLDHSDLCSFKGGGNRLSSYNRSVITTRPVQPSYLASLMPSYSATVRSLLQLSLQQCVFTVLLLFLASFSSVA